MIGQAINNARYLSLCFCIHAACVEEMRIGDSFDALTSLIKDSDAKVPVI